MNMMIAQTNGTMAFKPRLRLAPTLLILVRFILSGFDDIHYPS